MPVQLTIYNWTQWMVYKLSSLWDTTLSVFCISIIIAVLAISNHSIAFLLPLCIGIDCLISVYAAWQKYIQTFSEMRQDFSLFLELDEVDADLKKSYMQEMKRFKVYSEGNRFGTKSISVYVSRAINGGPTSYSFHSDESVVLLHKDFDNKEDNDRFTMLHEMVHCIGHSLIGQKQIVTRLHSSILALIIAIFSILSHSWWLLLIGILLWMVLMIVESSFYVNSRVEMGADAMACMIFEHLYGREKMRKIARIFTKKYTDEILDSHQLRNYSKFGYLLNEIYGISRFMSDNDKSRYIVSLNGRLASEKKCNSNNKLLIKRIEIIRRQVLNSPEIESFKNGIITWNPGWYYVVFPLLMVVAWFTTDKVILTVGFPWWYIFLCIVPILLIVLIKKKAANTAIAKSVFLQDIINKQLQKNETIKN